MKTVTIDKKRNKWLPAVLVLMLVVFMSVGEKPVQAAEGEGPYPLTVNMAAEDFMKEDPELKDVTLNIYRLADPDQGKVTDHGMETPLQTTFGEPKEIAGKGLYVVVPVLGDEVKKDTAGNVVVTTDEWIYTFSPMVVSVPANDVIYVKTQRQPIRGSIDIPDMTKHEKTTIVDSTITDTRDVKTGDRFPWYPLLIAAAAAMFVVLIRHKRTGAR